MNNDMIKHVFFDFNGTIIDDVNLCLNLLNEILEAQSKPLVDIKKYKEIFGFPIKEYYRAAGVDFNIESYESLSHKFIRYYQPLSFECGLVKGAEETFKFLKNNNIHLYILSASEKRNLSEQCEKYDIAKYFDAILGIDNIFAASKTDIAINYINNHEINRDEIIFIGDTLHDKEVADIMGVKCYLVTSGHQSFNRLKQANVEIYDDINFLRSNFYEIFN